MFCGSGGSKSRLAKAAGAETSGQMRNEKLHAVVARSRFGSKKRQNTSAPDHFWKLRYRKNVRRCGTKHIWKQKCQNTSAPEHFWTLRRGKSARRCGAKHIWNSKSAKHAIPGALLEVEMFKKCAPLWREAHLEVQSGKARWSRTIFGS